MNSRALFLYLAIGLSVFGARPVYAADTCESIFEPWAAKRLDELALKVDLSPGDRGMTDDELTAELKIAMRAGLDALNAHGTILKMASGGDFILLTNSGATPLNQLALDIWTSYGARLVSRPETIVKNQAVAIANKMNFGHGAEPTLVFGPAILARLIRGEDPRQSATLLHELRHLKDDKDLSLRIPSALYGDVSASRGLIPGKFKSGSMSYSKSLSFDEIKTYHQQTKQMLIELRGHVRAHEPIDASSGLVRNAAFLGFLVSVRSRASAQELLEVMNADPAKDIFVYSLGPADIVYAHARLASEDRELDYYFPLISSSGVSDARNHDFVKAQVNLLLEKAVVGVDQFMTVGKLFNETIDHLTVADIDRMQTILNPRALAPVPESRALALTPKSSAVSKP